MQRLHWYIKNDKLILKDSLKKNRVYRSLRTQFTLPVIMNNVKRFSFEVTAIKLLNIFHEDLFENKVNTFKSLIKNNILTDFEKSFFNENKIFVNENNFKKSKYYTNSNFIT